MTFPGFLFGFCIATLMGGIFHLIKDGGLGRLVLDMVLSWVGFTAGHFLAAKLGWAILDVGSLHLGLAALGSLVFLFIGHWLSQVQMETRA